MSLRLSQSRAIYILLKVREMIDRLNPKEVSTCILGKERVLRQVKSMSRKSTSQRWILQLVLKGWTLLHLIWTYSIKMFRESKIISCPLRIVVDSNPTSDLHPVIFRSAANLFKNMVALLERQSLLFQDLSQENTKSRKTPSAIIYTKSTNLSLPLTSNPIPSWCSPFLQPQ